MKNLLGPLMAASMASPACFAIHSSNPASAGCTTKECFLDQEFGVHSEGLQDDGAVLVCKDGIQNAEELVIVARLRYAQLHQCEYNDPFKKLDSEVTNTFYHRSIVWGVDTQVATTCSLVNQKDNLPCKAPQPEPTEPDEPLFTCTIDTKTDSKLSL